MSWRILEADEVDPDDLAGWAAVDDVTDDHDDDGTGLCAWCGLDRDDPDRGEVCGGEGTDDGADELPDYD